MSYVKVFSVVLMLLGSLHCANLVDDLIPSDENLTWKNNENYPGKVGKIVSDLSFTDSDGTVRHFSDYLPAKSGIAFYFTMWCSVCTAHTDYIINNIAPLYPNVHFFVVDFVSGTVADADTSATYTGIKGKIMVAADVKDVLTDYFGGVMSKTVVVDYNFEVLLNEDFQNGTRLKNTLDTLP